MRCGRSRVTKLANLRRSRTAPAFRRRGFFRALSRTILTDLYGRYPTALCVVVAATGEAPEHVYLRLGFEPIGRQFALVATVGDP